VRRVTLHKGHLVLSLYGKSERWKVGSFTDEELALTY
jgi:hypothetical protein